MLWYTPHEEQVCQPGYYILMCQMPCYVNGKAFSRVFIKNCHHAEAPAIPGSLVNEVITPYVIAMWWTEAYARAVVEPQSSTLRLTLWALSAPDALYPFMIDLPAFTTKQGCNTPVSITTIGCC
jgi:hypothetical protein